jgi:D-3-phosphoglycerate dehydrogenase / 2-oxoglutarate reductase
MKIIVIDTIHASLYSRLEENGHACVDASRLNDDEVFELLAKADGLVLRSRMTLDKAFINRFSHLKFIGRVGAGLEHIDKEFALEKGIAVLSSPEGNRQAVAEHALGSLLTLLNRIKTADAEVRKGRWIRKANEGVELQGKTIAIIGFGNTGEAFARVLSGFQTPIIAFDKYKSGFDSAVVKESAMEDVFESADVVSIHLPYNDETHYLVNDHWLAAFKKPVYLINTSRGNIVDTSALLKSMDSGKVLGACLDVLEFETENLKMPPLEELPESVNALMKNEKVVLTPHIAGLTVESYEKLSFILADKIIEAFGHA